MQAHRRYVNYLMAIGLQDHEITRLLEMDGLSVPTPATMARMRFEADLPVPFSPWNPDDPASGQWVNDHALRTLFDGESTAREAMTILRSSARHLVEVLLLAGVKAEEVSRFLEKHGLLPDVTGKGVEYFRHLFWDTQALPLDAWATGHPYGDLYLTAATAGRAKGIEVAETLVARLALPEKGTGR